LRAKPPATTFTSPATPNRGVRPETGGDAGEAHAVLALRRVRMLRLCRPRAAHGVTTHRKTCQHSPSPFVAQATPTMAAMSAMRIATLKLTCLK
jgi:hypothetical protein